MIAFLTIIVNVDSGTYGFATPGLFNINFTSSY